MQQLQQLRPDGGGSVMLYDIVLHSYCTCADDCHSPDLSHLSYSRSLSSKSKYKTSSDDNEVVTKVLSALGWI